MLKILSLSQIKEVELATMGSHKIESWQLMERAAKAITDTFISTFSPCNVYICVGKGGNGGDGVAVARLLNERGYKVSILTLYESDKCSKDYQKNLSLISDDTHITDNIELFFSTIESGAVVIDAIFGVGYHTRPLDDRVANVITKINSLDRAHLTVVSIDTPSGMECTVDAKVDQKSCVVSDKTFTIYSPKLSMLMPTCGEYAGDIVVVDIGYCKDALRAAKTDYYYICSVEEQKRAKFSHKGDFGSLLIVGAGEGMYGASIIAAKGANVAGCGLIRVVTPKPLLPALYSNIPSAMAEITHEEYFCALPPLLERYNVVCAGMCMGRDPKTIVAFKELLTVCRRAEIPMVIDADGLNIVSLSDDIFTLIPNGSILTPHLGEFRRLVGDYSSESEKLSKLISLASRTGSVVVLKGAHSAIANCDGSIYFNSTGCSALSRGGAGDLLSGVIAGILAQNRDSLAAAIKGVYNHGKAAENAAAKFSEPRATIDRIIDAY